MNDERNHWMGKAILAVKKSGASILSGLRKSSSRMVPGKEESTTLRIPDAHKRIQEELIAAVRSGDFAALKEVSARAAAMMGPAAFRGIRAFDRARNIFWSRVPLHEAVAKRNVECVDFLIPLSDVKQQNETGGNALMLAAHAGDIECFNRILPLSDVNAVDKNGVSALMLIAPEGFDERHNALLAAGCDVDSVSSFGDCALGFALAGDNHALAHALLPRTNQATRKRVFRVALVHARVQEIGGLGSRDAMHESWGFVDQLAFCVSEAEGEEAFEHCGRSAEKMPAWAAKIEARALRGAIGVESMAGRVAETARNAKRSARL